jgi:hypothetical protein
MLENTQLNYDRAPLQRTKRQGDWLLLLLSLLLISKSISRDRICNTLTRILAIEID